MRLGSLRRNSAQSTAEAGYFLIAIMIMVAVLAILSLAHVQNVVTELKHDQEVELVHRGAQYARGIKKYYKKFGQYPVSLDQLEKSTNNMRFLRKRYKDPTNGEDFRLLHQADVIFGQNASTDSSTSGGSTDQNRGNPTGQNPSNPNAKSQQSSIFKPIGSSSGTGSGSAFGAGGGPILGVASKNAKTSLMEFDGKNHYKDWMFIYLPNFDRGALIKGPYVKSQSLGGVAPSGIGVPVNRMGGNNSPLQPQTRQ